MRTVLNKKNVDYLKQPMFLGEDLSLQRYDRFKYPEFFDLFKKQLELFWRPEEIELTKDRVDFKSLKDHEKFIFTSNLLYQTTMDSVVSRGSSIFADYVSSPELEAAINVWSFFEQLHSYSYTYIIKNVYPNPSEIFDMALEDEEIMRRANSISQAYDDLMNCTTNLKEQIYLSLISVNILEAVRFYVSFVCSFAFGENKKMLGNAEIIKLIRRDEAYHYRLSQTIINKLHTDESEGFTEVSEDLRDTAVKMFLDASIEEKAWAEYIFSQGSMMGLNAQILSQYIEFLTDSRMEAIGLPKYYGTKNPIAGWIEPWMNSSSVQTAPQELELSSYKIGATKNDLSNMEFGNFL